MNEYIERTSTCTYLPAYLPTYLPLFLLLPLLVVSGWVEGGRWKVDVLYVKETNLGIKKKQTLVELKREGRRLEEEEEGEEIFFYARVYPPLGYFFFFFFLVFFFCRRRGC